MISRPFFQGITTLLFVALSLNAFAWLTAAELAAWTKAQGDDLQSHQPPYLTSEPLPDLRLTPKKRQR